MKTVAVVSDSHGNVAGLEKLFPLFSECDAVIHLGDTSGDGAKIAAAFPGKTYLLNGNCDFIRAGKDELVIELEGVKIFACHGDRYGVKRDCLRLSLRAGELGCKVALYGHTHRADEDEAGGVQLFNPGTMSRYAQNSYLYLVISGDKCVGKIVRL